MCYDAEPLLLEKETYPKARKQYTCCECGSTIDIGEEYQRVTGLFDGSWETWRTCIVCSRIRAAAYAEIDEPIAFTCLYELVGSEFEDAAI